MTLDDATSNALKKHARRVGKPRAAVARELLREALSRRDAVERQRKLARDYADGRADTRAVLAELESAQLDLLDGDGHA